MRLNACETCRRRTWRANGATGTVARYTRFEALPFTQTARSRKTTSSSVSKTSTAAPSAAKAFARATTTVAGSSSTRTASVELWALVRASSHNDRAKSGMRRYETRARIAVASASSTTWSKTSGRSPARGRAPSTTTCVGCPRIVTPWIRAKRFSTKAP
eukprot:Amastigsp_a176039_17.p3 type:complete len:159 gc:universal Amastigsp_a176039_17:960-1436(+)